MSERQPAPGWGHLGNGLYANPVLPGDYSDPDVIRVGDDYWMITSTFQYSPGMAILHSRDLISWRHVGAAVRDVGVLGPEYRWDRMARCNGPDREREPNQGALVDHADGSWSLVTHHGRGGYADGRPVSVVPLQWTDGWPVVGMADAPGTMLWRASGSTATICVHTDGFADQQSAGFGVLCQRSSAITVTGSGALATTGEHPATGPTVGSGPIWLRLVVDDRNYITYAYSTDGITFEPVGNTDLASWSDYRGTRLALFTTAPTDNAGTARFTAFRYRIRQNHLIMPPGEL